VERGPAARLPSHGPTCSDSATPTIWSAPTTVAGGHVTATAGAAGPCDFDGVIVQAVDGVAPRRWLHVVRESGWR
jgi:hypothetical protein